MRGDLKTLWSALRRVESDNCPVRKPTLAVIGAFLRDFARMPYYDELATDDWVPAFAELMALAQSDIDERWRYYEQLAGIERTVAHSHEEGT